MKFEGGTKYDIGSESGIGSDSDSGNGITSSTDPLRNSPSAPSTFFRPPGKDSVIDPRTFGPLPLRSTPFQPEHDADYLISRLIVAAPPPSSSPLPSKSSVQHEAAQRNLTPRFQSPMVGYQHRSQSKPTVTNGDGVSSTPLGLGAVLGKESRDTKEEPVRIGKTTGDKHLGTLDAPQDPRSSPSPDPSQERNFSVSRTLATKWEGKTNSGHAASRILKNSRNSVNVATELSSVQSSNTRQKTATLSRSSSRTELYAWGDVPGLPTPSQSVVRSSKPMINSEKSVSAIDSDTRRSSQPSLETSRKSKLFLRKDETQSESVGGRNVSGQWRNSEGLNGSTVDLRRNKWSSVSEFLPKGSAEVSEVRDDVSDNEGSDLENIENVKKGASPIEDNFSSLVRLREKNGKPAQMARINHRTVKAQSMLSLYDTSSDAKEKAKVKKSNKNETGGSSDSRKRLSTFLQRKLKFYKKSNEGTTVRQSYDGTDLANGGVISKADSAETELHRSDYLGPNIFPVPVRSSIPSPSLYSSLENKNGNNVRTRSRSVGPGHISEIFRIDSRDLNIDDDRPRLTFDTFRGQIEPIRWRDEKTDISGTNGSNNASVTNVSSEQSLVPSLAVNMSASNGNNPIHLDTDNRLHRPNGHFVSGIQDI